METVIQSVGALGLSERTALERLVGHPLLDDQRLVIRIDGAIGSAHHDANSKPSWPEWCNVFEGLSDERVDEIDRAIVRSSNSREVEP